MAQLWKTVPGVMTADPKLVPHARRLRTLGWSEAAELIESGHDVILAGGLAPENVGQALSDLGDMPWGVDVATGVEGDGHRKDEKKLRQFVEAVRTAEALPEDEA